VVLDIEGIERWAHHYRMRMLHCRMAVIHRHMTNRHVIRLDARFVRTESPRPAVQAAVARRSTARIKMLLPHGAGGAGRLDHADRVGGRPVRQGA
jgi:hypothetical protein